MELLQKRTIEIKKTQALRKERLAIGSGYTACLVIIAAIALAAANMKFDNVVTIPLVNTASIFADAQSLGYAVVGIFAFVLGVAVTLLCAAVHKKNKGEDDGDGAGR